ncbi:MAG: FkbM family methyltransferase [Aquificae bacterium]|nr:FkbM family methyltransferase [Aquificota bacterium]
MKFKTPDAVGRFVYKRGTYEPEVLKVVEEMGIGPGSVIFDVGAHFGWYSLLFDRLTAGKGLVFALEPAPENYRLLTENLILNATKAVFPLKVAAGARPGQLKLFLYPDKNTGRCSFVERTDRWVEVPVVPLDAFLKPYDLKKVKLLKVDAEGFEPFVLKGAEKLLERTEFVVFEFSPRLYGYLKEEFLGFLDRLPFEIFVVGPEGPGRTTPEGLRHLEKQVNLLLVRK